MKKLLLILLCLPLLFSCNSNNRKVPIELEKYYQLIEGDWEVSKWKVLRQSNKQLSGPSFTADEFILTKKYSAYLRFCRENRSYSLLFFNTNGEITKHSIYGNFSIYNKNLSNNFPFFEFMFFLKLKIKIKDIYLISII